MLMMSDYLGLNGAGRWVLWLTGGGSEQYGYGGCGGLEMSGVGLGWAGLGEVRAVGGKDAAQ